MLINHVFQLKKWECFIISSINKNFKNSILRFFSQIYGPFKFFFGNLNIFFRQREVDKAQERAQRNAQRMGIPYSTTEFEGNCIFPQMRF